MALAVALHTSDENSTVAVTGELDCATSAPLRGFLEAEIAQCARDVVVDLRKIDFIGADGLTVLLAARMQLAAQDRRLSVACADPMTMRLFVMTGLTETLEVYIPAAA